MLCPSPLLVPCVTRSLGLQCDSPVGTIQWKEDAGWAPGQGWEARRRGDPRCRGRSCMSQARLHRLRSSGCPWGRGCSLRIQAALGRGEMIAGLPALPRRRDMVPGGAKPQGGAAERRGWGKGGRRSTPTARDHDRMSGPEAAPSEDGAAQWLPP